MMNFDEVAAQVKPKTATVKVCLRGDLLAQHEQLEEELAEARRLDELENRHSQAAVIAEKIRELETEIDQAETAFTFQAIGQKAWTDLAAQHPPREEDEQVGNDFNSLTFPVAAIAASAIEPTMTVENSEWLFAKLNLGQWRKLWDGCLRANVVGTDVPFSAAAYVALGGSATKSEPPTTTESPEASSLDE